MWQLSLTTRKKFKRPSLVGTISVCISMCKRCSTLAKDVLWYWRCTVNVNNYNYLGRCTSLSNSFNLKSRILQNISKSYGSTQWFSTFLPGVPPRSFFHLTYHLPYKLSQNSPKTASLLILLNPL